MTQKIIIVVAVIAIIGLGVLAYNKFSSYEPDTSLVNRTATSNTSEPAKTTAPSDVAPVSSTPSSSAPAATGKYAAWVGDWIIDGQQGSEALHISLDAQQRPVFEPIVPIMDKEPLPQFPNISAQKDFDKNAIPRFEFIEAPDETTVKTKMVFKGAAPPNAPSIEISFKFDAATDKITMEMSSSQLPNIPQKKQTLTRGKGDAEILSSRVSVDDIVRASCSRARSDMRSFATALEANYVDNNKYADPGQGDYPPSSLTTPIAYIAKFFPDPFAREKGATYRYYVIQQPNKVLWILISGGPDGAIDITKEVFNSEVSTANLQNTLNLFSSYAYDPTNGTFSRGDVFRIRQ